MPRLTFHGLVLVGFLAGCGSFQFEASGSGDPTGGGQTSEMGRRVEKAYASWTSEACDTSCGQYFAREAGVLPDGQRGGALENPKGSMTNPDPEWLPGWDALPSDESGAPDVWAALAQAASNRNWARSCKKGYEAYKKSLEARMTKVEAEIDAALAKTDPLERVRALLALADRSTKQFQSENEFSPQFDAVSYQVEKALIDELRKQGKAWVLQAERKNVGSNTLELLAPRWDAALEERAYCSVAAHKGLGEVKPLAPSRVDPAIVKPVFSEAELKDLSDKRKARREATAKALSTEDPKGPKEPEHRGTRKDDKLVSFTVTNGKATIKLQRKAEYGASIGETCIDQAGRIFACPTMKVKKDEQTTIVFDDWPSGLKLEDGDTIQFFGDLVSSDIKGQGTPIEKWTQEFRGRHLALIVKKDGTTIAYW